MKKKRKIIIWAIVLTVLTSVSGVLIWQRDNVKAFFMSLKYSREEIGEKMSENDRSLKEELEKKYSIKIREYTEEEKELIASGKMSEKQVLAKIIAESLRTGSRDDEISDKIAGSQKDKNAVITFDKSEVLVPITATEAEKKKKDEKNPTLVVVGKPSEQVPDTPAKQTADEIIKKHIASLYALEAKYIGAIESVVASAKAAAKARGLTKKDTSELLAIGASYTSTINSLEAKCDGEVEAVISSLKSELTAIGADLSIIETIRTAYANEKSLKRAYYMNMIY